MRLLEKFQNNPNALGWAFMLPAAVLLPFQNGAAHARPRPA